MTNNKAQQSAEKTAEQQQVLRDLLALGKKNGRLTLKEMADALSHLELESDDIDKLYETLESMGVEVETEGVLEKALGELMEKQQTSFPKRLSLIDQGSFLLGYYQQKQARYKKNDEQEA